MWSRIDRFFFSFFFGGADCGFNSIFKGTNIWPRTNPFFRNFMQTLPYPSISLFPYFFFPEKKKILQNDKLRKEENKPEEKLNKTISLSFFHPVQSISHKIFSINNFLFSIASGHAKNPFSVPNSLCGWPSTNSFKIYCGI